MEGGGLLAVHCSQVGRYTVKPDMVKMRVMFVHYLSLRLGLMSNTCVFEGLRLVVGGRGVVMGFCGYSRAEVKLALCCNF